MRKTLVVISLVILIIILCSCGMGLTNQEKYNLLSSNELAVDTIRATFPYDDNKLVEVVGYSDYVFVGKVIEYIEFITDTPSEIPETIFSIEVVKNIKGNLDKNKVVLLKKGGGLSKNNKTKVIFEDDILPLKNEFYIFSVNGSENGELNCSGKNTTVKVEGKNNFAEDPIFKSFELAYQNQTNFDRKRNKSKFEE